jgi:hypothetical protein
MHQWLSDMPRQFGPYSIYGSWLVKRNRKHQRVLFNYQLGEYLDLLSGKASRITRPTHQFFLHAAAVMPIISLDDAVGQENDFASVNALVLIQHGAFRSGRQLPSRIAVTDEIRNKESGEVLQLKDRAVVFDTLRDMVKSKLCFNSIQVFRDGHEEEDDTELMTAEAAELAVSGHFVRRPGRPIDL